MRKSKRCPKCDHDKILLVAEVPDAMDGNWTQPLHIATVLTGKTTFMGDPKTKPAGALSAAVCRACGFVELYVTDPASLVADGTLVREA